MFEGVLQDIVDHLDESGSSGNNAHDGLYAHRRETVTLTASGSTTAVITTTNSYPLVRAPPLVFATYKDSALDNVPVGSGQFAGDLNVAWRDPGAGSYWQLIYTNDNVSDITGLKVGIFDSVP